MVAHLALVLLRVVVHELDGQGRQDLVVLHLRAPAFFGVQQVVTEPRAVLRNLNVEQLQIPVFRVVELPLVNGRNDVASLLQGDSPTVPVLASDPSGLSP